MPTSQSRKPDLTLILDFGGSLTRGEFIETKMVNPSCC
jgi:hypothetical protein